MRLVPVFGVLIVLFCSCTMAQEGVKPQGSEEPLRTGKQVFDQACFSCHGTGLADAPVRGDRYAWEERLARGTTILFQNTLNGVNSMPPRGGCLDCSDAELREALTYLLSD